MKKTRRNVDSEWNENDVVNLEAIDQAMNFIEKAYHSTYIIEALTKGAVANLANKDLKTLGDFAKEVYSQISDARKDLEDYSKLIHKHIADLPYYIIFKELRELRCDDVSKQIRIAEINGLAPQICDYADEIEEMNAQNAKKLLEYNEYVLANCDEREMPKYSYADIAQTILGINTIQKNVVSMVKDGVEKLNSKEDSLKK